MINTNSAYVSRVKAGVCNTKNILGLLMGLSVCVSIIYFIYYALVMSDDYILSYTEYLFKPLAQFLNPDETTLEMYRYTSIDLLKVTIPLLIACYLCDKVETVLIYLHSKKEEFEERRLRIKAHKDSLVQYDIIKNYSICLSLDYQSSRKLSQQTKDSLNRILFANLRSSIKQFVPFVNIVTEKDALIITSNDFSKYDEVYSVTLKTLAINLKNAKEKFDIELIPSITTDAYNKSFDINKIKKEHFEIQDFHCKNRACSTALFYKKYKHLKKNKYAGVPIGAYASSNKYKTNTYDLNVVCKDLAKELASFN